MQDDSPRPAQGSSRRRPRNNPNKRTPQRNYASESDMSSVQARLPQTPQKSASSSPAPASTAGHQPSSRRGGKEKSRPRNLPLSPDSARTNRQASHPAPIPKAGVANAFAGATFHASPAPSSLPLPSFLSKGAESPTASGADLGRPISSQEAEASMPTPSRVSLPQTREASGPTPSCASPSPVARDSPLEFMFKADREEKEQARRASLARTSQHKSTLSASSISHSPSRSTNTQFHEPHSPSPVRYGYAEVGRTATEGKHQFGKAIGPSFSAPYQERIRAAKHTSTSNHPKVANWEPVSSVPDTTDRSEALKRYLFGNSNREGSGINSVSSGTPTVPTVSATTSHINQTENPSPRDEEVVAMENNLRRLLNLDPSITSRNPHPVRQSQ